MSDDLEILLAEASQLRQAGRTYEAIAAYERVLAAKADLPNSWYNLGLLYRQAGRAQEALNAYEAALNLDIDAPEHVYLNRAVVYADLLGDDRSAERELGLALAFNPNFLPALINLGNLEAERGNRDAAVKAYTKVLARQPWFFSALARYASLQTARGPSDPLLDRLRRGLTMPDAEIADRAAMGFALGRLLDAVGEYDEAFAVYSAANADAVNAAPFSTPGYDPAAQEAQIAAIIAAFTPAVLADIVAAGAGQAPEPIFICGMFRSGSTMCEQVLASHSEVTMGGELDFLPALIAEHFPDGAIDAVRAAACAQAYRARLSARFPGAKLVTDKLPENYLHIGYIKAMFPEARIVQTQRAPLDNCLSIFFLNADPRAAYKRDLADIGHHYRQHRRLMAHWQQLLGDGLYVFDYDRFVREQRAVTEELLRYCRLAWEEGCIAFHKAQTTVRTASAEQVREPLYDRSSGRARHYAKHLAPLRAALGDLAGD